MGGLGRDECLKGGGGARKGNARSMGGFVCLYVCMMAIWDVY